MKIIAGTVQSAVKLDMLTTNWEQKKKSNMIFSRQELNKRANMSPEEKMLEQFKEEMAQNREQNRSNSIANKIMNGEDLTIEEIQYLERKNPAQLNSYRQMKEEQKAEEAELRKCKTKDEVQEYKLQKMGEFLSELKSAHGDAEAAKAMEILQKLRIFQKAEQNFIESGVYAKLPTEADEAIDRAEERNDKQEENLETINNSIKKEEIMESDDGEIRSESKTYNNTTSDLDLELKDVDKKTIYRQEEKNPEEEIEDICRKYFSNMNNTFKPITDGIDKIQSTETIDLLM